MPLRHAVPLIFLAGLVVGVALHRAIPAAWACAAPVDTEGTFDLTLAAVAEMTSTGASVEEETLTWSETGILSLPDGTLTLADGTTLVFE